MRSQVWKSLNSTLIFYTNTEKHNISKNKKI